MDADIVIVGAGPAGLCFARSLAGSGLAVTVVEERGAAELAAAPFDGREIALSHHSAWLLRQLGVWEGIPAGDVHELRDARVLDGATLPGMRLDPSDGPRPQLGFLVSMNLIRRAAWAAVAGQGGLQLLTGRRVVAVAPGADRVRLTLADGGRLSARLLVAADSRFSTTRRAMGIAADSHDFGRTMLVGRMRHERPHGHCAWEWFDHGQTLALLPLGEHESSVVVTLPPAEIARLVAAPDDEFGAAMEQRFGHRLGRMSPTSTRHAYPLVGVYPHRFTAARFALVGDAAVGMHPVTAHGFNFGLLGQDLLAGAIRAQAKSGGDVADPAVLERYGRELRRATRPLYLATALLVKLYTDDRAPARLLRRAVLGAGARLAPARRALVRGLMQAGDSRAATFPLLGLLRSLPP